MEDEDQNIVTISSKWNGYVDKIINDDICIHQTTDMLDSYKLDSCLANCIRADSSANSRRLSTNSNCSTIDCNGYLPNNMPLSKFVANGLKQRTYCIAYVLEPFDVGSWNINRKLMEQTAFQIMYDAATDNFQIPSAYADINPTVVSTVKLLENTSQLEANEVDDSLCKLVSSIIDTYEDGKTKCYCYESPSSTALTEFAVNKYHCASAHSQMKEFSW